MLTTYRGRCHPRMRQMTGPGASLLSVGCVAMCVGAGAWYRGRPGLHCTTKALPKQWRAWTATSGPVICTMLVVATRRRWRSTASVSVFWIRTGALYAARAKPTLAPPQQARPWNPTRIRRQFLVSPPVLTRRPCVMGRRCCLIPRRLLHRKKMASFARRLRKWAGAVASQPRRPLAAWGRPQRRRSAGRSVAKRVGSLRWGKGPEAVGMCVPEVWRFGVTCCRKKCPCRIPRRKGALSGAGAP